MCNKGSSLFSRRKQALHRGNRRGHVPVVRPMPSSPSRQIYAGASVFV